MGLILFLCLSISAQGVEPRLSGDWRKKAPVIAPPAVFSPEMVYDSESDRIVLFSGAITPYVVHNGTWIYDYNTNTWENVTPAISPGGRSTSSMAYDQESDRAILFGGMRKYFDNGTLWEWGDTWAYDQNTNSWENMTPDVGPHYRSMHNMAYDNESDRAILFGGLWGDSSAPDGRRALSDTWAYDYNTNTWENMSPDISPNSLYAFGMAYDNESDRTVLYGGKFKSDGVSSLKDETWVYDYNSNSWTKMHPPTNPGVRERFQMTYFTGLGVVLYGGDNGSTILNDTWLYDYNSNNWTELELRDPPSKRYYFDLAYDYESYWVVLFGGCANQFDEVLNETWALSLYFAGPFDFPIITLPPVIAPLAQILILTGSIGAGLIVLVLFLKKRSQLRR